MKRLMTSIIAVCTVFVLLSPTFAQNYREEDVKCFLDSQTLKFGFIHRNGQILVRQQFDGCWGDPKEGLAAVKVNDLWGYIKMDYEKTGKYYIAPTFDSARNFSEGLAAVVIGGTNGFIDLNFNKTRTFAFEIDPQIEWVGNFSEGLAAAGMTDEGRSYGERSGFINKKGEWHIEPMFDDVGDFHEGLAAFLIFAENGPNLMGYIDKDYSSTQEFAIEPIFNIAEDFQEGIALVETVAESGEYLFGYIKKDFAKTGKYFIEPQFKWAQGFSEGVAAVGIDGKWGFIDRNYPITGKFLIEPKYYSAGSFEYGDGLARVSLTEHGNAVFIDKTGKIIFETPFKYENN